jgi:hypothetical protein
VLRRLTALLSGSGFIEQEGSTLDQFYAECKRVSEEAAQSGGFVKNGWFLDMLLASMEYSRCRPYRPRPDWTSSTALALQHVQYVPQHSLAASRAPP